MQQNIIFQSFWCRELHFELVQSFCWKHSISEYTIVTRSEPVTSVSKCETKSDVTIVTYMTWDLYHLRKSIKLHIWIIFDVVIMKTQPFVWQLSRSKFMALTFINLHLTLRVARIQLACALAITKTTIPRFQDICLNFYGLMMSGKWTCLPDIVRIVGW